MLNERRIKAYLRDKQNEVERLETDTTLGTRELHFKNVMIATLEIEINLLKRVLEE